MFNNYPEGLNEDDLNHIYGNVEEKKENRKQYYRIWTNGGRYYKGGDYNNVILTTEPLDATPVSEDDLDFYMSLFDEDADSPYAEEWYSVVEEV